MLDTLATAKKLRGAGFSEEQAEALTAAVQQAAGMPDISQLATKDDVAQLRAATKDDITQLRAEMLAAIAELKADLQRWTINLVLGALVLNVVVVVGSMIALVRLTGH